MSNCGGERILGGWAARSFASKTKKGGKKKGKTPRDDPVQSNPVEQRPHEEEKSVDFEALECEQEALVDSLKLDFAKMRPNRAMPGMLDHVSVSAYGDAMPLQHLATTNVRDTSTLVVNVYDKQLVDSVEKAIRDCSLGLNPAKEGEEIVVHVPRPTREMLEEMCKVVKSHVEQKKNQLRELRRKAYQVAKAIDDKDEKLREERQVDAYFDKCSKRIQELGAMKETEVRGGQ